MKNILSIDVVRDVRERQKRISSIADDALTEDIKNKYLSLVIPMDFDAEAFLSQRGVQTLSHLRIVRATISLT